MCATVVVLGIRLGHAPGLVALLCLSGIGAALGVRNAAEQDRFAVVGVVPLWLAALVFTVVTSALVRAAGAPVATLAIAAAALLGPFGVVGNTVRTYGEGTGRTLLGRYLAGTLVLAALVIGYGLLLGVLTAGVESVLGAEIGNGIGSLLPTTLGGRILAAAILFPVALYLSVRASERFPAEVLVPFQEIERVQESRSRIERLHRRGWQALGVLALLVVVGYAARFGASEADDSSADAVGTLADVILGAVGVITSRPVLAGTLVVILLALLVLAGIYVVRQYGTASATVLTQTVGPPLALVVVSIVLAAALGPWLPLGTLESIAGRIAVPESSFHTLLVDYPSLLILILSTVAILASALVFSVPTALAAGPAIDESLAGLAAAVLALVVLVVAAVVDGDHALVVVGGIAVIAVVWELGEYATVAAGELRTESTLPPGFTTLTSIHAAASGAVAIVAAIVATTVALVAGGASLPGAFALLAIIVSVLGLTGLMLLLTG